MHLPHTEIKVRVEDSGSMFLDLSGDENCGLKYQYTWDLTIEQLNHWIEELQHIRVRAIKTHHEETTCQTPNQNPRLSK